MTGAVNEPLGVNEGSVELFLRLLFSLAAGSTLVPDSLLMDFGVADYTLAARKVVWREVADELDAAVVGETEVLGIPKPVVPDHTCILVECANADEAHYLCAILNSGPVRLAVSNYIVLHPGPHVLERVRVPRFSDKNRVHLRLAKLYQEAHRAAGEGDRVGEFFGVTKSFSRGPLELPGSRRRQEVNLYELLAGLPCSARTCAFSARAGQVVMWYVRVREQRHLDYPLMGVIKVEFPNPRREAVPSELVDEVSAVLVAERHVTPYGKDVRWHAHLYGIYLAEQAVKSGFISNEALEPG